MVIAYHAIWSAYGFWLPNEQRGSWSTEVWAPHLKQFGPATKTTERRSLAKNAHDRDRRKEMRESLKFPAVHFNPDQIQTVARGFAKAIDMFAIVVFACAIMLDHVHFVLDRHQSTVEYLVGVLKRAATRELNVDKLNPLGGCTRDNGRTPSPWTEDGWVRYLNTDVEIVDAIGYVGRNPPRIGMPKQNWDFVVPFRQ